MKQQPAARKRAREIFIASKGQEPYEAIQLQLRLEGLGENSIDLLRHWRQRDIKAGYVNLDELAKEYERIGKQVEKVAQTLNLPANLTTAEKVEAAKLADLEDTHERMLRVVNVSAARLAETIPHIHIHEVSDATALANVAATIADASIRLRLALINVREASMKIVSASSDGKPVRAELMEPEHKVSGFKGALAAFRKAT
jgi:hypothetical protein